MQINIYEAKSQLSKLAERAVAGEDIVIAKAGKPLIRLVPYNPKLSPRQPGLLAGQIDIAGDAFSEDTEADIAELFNDSTLFPAETHHHDNSGNKK